MDISEVHFLGHTFAPPIPDADTMRSLALSVIPLGMTATTSFVPENPFKYMYSSAVMEQSASYLGGDPLTVSEIDNYLYHGSLLILFKVIFGASFVNNPYLLTALSTPAIRKVIVDSEFFQNCKTVCALKILLILSKQAGTSAAKKIAFSAIKSYLDQTPLKHLIKEIKLDTPPEKILFIFQDSLDKLYRLKKREATHLVDDLTLEFHELTRGRINLEKLMKTANDAYNFTQNFSTDSSESLSLLSTRALSYAVGQTALYTTGSPLSICANLSKHPTLTELSLRVAGSLVASFYPGLAPLIATEAAVKFLAPPIARQLGDDGSQLAVLKRKGADLHDSFCQEIRLTSRETLRQIDAYETIFFETLTLSALALIGKSLHPAVYSLTATHMIQNLESQTTIVTPSKKIDFIPAMTIQAPLALALTVLHTTVFQGPASRAFLNAGALAISSPFIMNKLLQIHPIQEAAKFVRDQIPGFRVADSLAPVQAGVDTLAPIASTKLPLAHYAPSAIKVYKAARVMQNIVDHLGGVETITRRSMQATSSTLALYGNYATFSIAAGALGPHIGVIAIGSGMGKRLSKTAISASIIAGGLVYTYTQSPALTSFVVTAIHAISESEFAVRAATRARDMFRRFF